MQAKERIGWIDIAKAMGIFVVLMNHVMLDLGVVTFLGGMFYMPVFFVLSGYTFKENTELPLARFVKGKARRLLVPYACFQFVLAGMFTVKNLIQGQPFLQAVMPVIGAFYSRNALYANAGDVMVSVPQKNINLMTSLNAPLWFLTGLFLSLVIYQFILIKAGQNKKKEFVYLGISVLIGILLKYFSSILLPWSLDTAFISVAFLHAGRMLAREGRFEAIYKKPTAVAGIVVLFIAASYLNGSVNMSIRDFGKSVLLYLVVGSLGTICVMFVSKLIENYLGYFARLLALIGRHSIGVFALHLIVFAAVGYAFTYIGFTHDILEKVAKILLSVVILVPIDGLIQRYLPFVYGQKRRNK
ncbi:acyltransferase family protein [Konateibacter massiliensis]|uniref:acyltransferase family protein n=1 Tax=Konateibacter massiliensis TaxID=2002841 RepID=UPI000C148413|nr:acyltransferase family protein [Konateibacter massiliensis]